MDVNNGFFEVRQNNLVCCEATRSGSKRCEACRVVKGGGRCGAIPPQSLMDLSIQSMRYPQKILIQRFSLLNPGIRQFIWEYAVVLERVLFRIVEAGLTVSGRRWKF
ncbi:hypothetical protein PPACK8108_LOCUS10882 [Phakopsora pachyrhizi]|uniref:Uncharacterized protein n=1 Tax=Phakopsora pachyrhizi TaxID=170000 RepID=A0AAV0B141_PHAPC|nr:hypothetical protein PPACK8108_LOCUS10882 [Phakopsora pachyrhizi]